MSDNLLQINNLKTYFFTDDGVAKAVDGITLSVAKGETLGIVGESGCGKSVTALSVMGLIPKPPGKIVSGEIIFNGQNLLDFSEKEIRKIRGNKISMIFQEPMTSLNPVFTCGDQVQETVELHQNLDKKTARKKTIEMFQLVGIPSPEQRVDEYPHEMSGGMRQRVMIAMALSCNPALIFADEPTTALDVTIQAQILDLMNHLQKKIGMAIVMITHDLGVIAEIADNVAVMYAGQIIEYCDIKSIFKSPLHPYTKGLLASIPKINEDKDRLTAIKGAVPNPLNFPNGCRFHPRCPKANNQCKKNIPQFIKYKKKHHVRCWLYHD